MHLQNELSRSLGCRLGSASPCCLHKGLASSHCWIHNPRSRSTKEGPCLSEDKNQAPKGMQRYLLSGHYTCPVLAKSQLPSHQHRTHREKRVAADATTNGGKKVGNTCRGMLGGVTSHLCEDSRQPMETDQVHTWPGSNGNDHSYHFQMCMSLETSVVQEIDIICHLTLKQPYR